MNNEAPLTSGDLSALAYAFGISFTTFYLVFEASYYLYEKKSREPSDNKCLIEYRRWTPQKKADFVSRITSQLHAFVAIVLSSKALFFTW